MSPEQDTPDDPALQEELMRKSYGDPQLYELNLTRLDWERTIAEVHGFNNLSPEQKEQFFEFQQRHTERVRQLREQGITNPDED